MRRGYADDLKEFVRNYRVENDDGYIVLSIAGALMLLVWSLSMGLTSVYPHALDIPIVLVAGRYPKRALSFAAGTSIVYLCLYALFIVPLFPSFWYAAARCFVFFLVAISVSYYSKQFSFSRHEYFSLFDNLAESAYLFELRPDGNPGRIFEANDMMSRHLGYTREELIGMELSVIIAPEYRDAVQESLSETVKATYLTLESAHICKDGTRIPVEVKLHCYNSPNRGMVVLSVASDQTERKRRDRALQVQRDVAFALNRAVSVDEVGWESSAGVRKLALVPASGFYLRDEETGEMRLLYSEGVPPGFRKENAVFSLESPALAGLRKGTALYCLFGDLHTFGAVRASSLPFRGTAVLPVIAADTLVGLITLASMDEDEILPLIRPHIESIAAQAGVAIGRLRAEEALRRNEESLRALVDSMDEVQVLVGTDGVIIEANAALARRYRLSKEELAGTSIFRLYADSPATLDLRRGKMEEVASRCESVLFSDEHRGRSFTHIYYPVVDKEGAVYAIGLLSHDITEIKAEQEARAEAEGLYRLVVEAIRFGLFDYDVPRQRFKFSPEWYQLLGYEPYEMPEAYETWVALLHPDERDTVTGNLERTLRAGNVYFNEYRMLRKDGSWAWIKARGRVIERDDHGHPLRMVGVHTDITPWKEAQEKEHESALRLKKAQSIARIGYFEYDPAEDVIDSDVMADHIFGDVYADEKSGFADFLSMIHSNDRVQIHTRFAELLKNGGTFDDTCRIRLAGGEVKWIHLIGDSVLDEDGTVVRLIGTVQDISDIQEARDQLVRTQHVVDHSPEAIFFVNVDGTIFYGNETAARSYGKGGEVTGLSIFDINSEIDEDVWDEHWRLLKNQHVSTFETVYRHRDGTDHPVESTWEYIRTADHEFGCAFVRDITPRRRIAEALRESEKRFSLAVEGARLGVWDWNVAAGEILYDHRCAEILGYRPEEIPLRIDEIRSLFAPGDAHVIADIYQSLETADDAGTIEYRMYAKDGTVRWIRSHAVILERQPDGTPGRVIGTNLDITPLKEEGMLLEQSEAELREAQTIAGLGYWDYGEYGTSQHWSDRTFEIFGIPPTEDRLVSAQRFLGILHPSERETVVREFFDSIRGREDYEHTYRIIWPSGEIRHVHERCHHTYDDGGNYHSSLGTLIDITDLKRAEAALRESEQKFRLLAENSIVGIYIISGERFIYVNETMAEMFGYTVGELRNKPNLELISPADVGMVVDHVHDLVAGRMETAHFETVGVRKDGSTFEIEIFGSGAQLDDEHPLIIGTLLDISERKASEAMLQASLAEKTTLLNEVHHRVKNNLALITSMLQMQMRSMEDEEAKAVLRETSNRILSMALVHESIYRSDTIAHINAGDHFHSLVMELISTFAPFTVITAHVDGGGCQLTLEEGILYSLIVNELVTNAIKYAFAGRNRGTISVVMECGENGKVLTVGDDGIGVSEDYRPGASTSLGMNIVRNVVMHQLGGTIELQRDGGTSWVIRIPDRETGHGI
ncbi:hypothetical protein AZH53_09420 [Methanomicrobiaceae archaeon CYW5]|uniref:PAS domain-containing protein n=1 Tax=Methanovulcanius yangii TaxID=1789227 RepID=UPI0029CA423D|nr:PAS domain-containing protein [Methanovulcanius yangii]MBT8508622.1 hypothetical protein [Methanovulcanius yangii]